MEEKTCFFIGSHLASDALSPQLTRPSSGTSWSTA